uniref:Uncharacterized protein ycf35 n=1 Tax=Erythroglossum lusitanicum TaxID=2575615 RepID=A0A4D6WY49_9FLOR|nr:hypothetical protein [Erythroglossum lusitanicum]
MSHFSRIKTNISNFEILIKTLNDLGFKYKFNQFSNSIIDKNKLSNLDNIFVYNNLSDDKSLFNFSWDGSQYILLADFQLWNLDINIDYFLEQLNQKYAYNIILNRANSNGFQKSDQKIMLDGSIKVIMQRWNIY